MDESKEKDKSMFAEDDSDNESDFDVKYDQPGDFFEDLKPLQSRPLFISDLI